MGFYHSTTVLFGAKVKTDDPHKTEYHVFDLDTAEKAFSRFGVQHSLAGAADREEVYLYTVYHNLEIGDTFSTAEDNGDFINLWRDRIETCANTLGVEIENVGWVTIHEYR